MNKNLLILLATVFSLCISVPAMSQENTKKILPSGKHVYMAQPPAKKNLFIVISKKNLQLSVYGKQGSDTVLVCTYPVCLSLNKGNKQRRGDMKTPESPKGRPFKITQIQDASGWRHNFGDGRGNILAYGHWFLRLLTPGHSGIGIHGSTNNEHTVPGRASEGCIRLKDGDIIHLKENYAYVNMPVIIQAENDNPMPFEVRAKKKYGDEEEVIDTEEVIEDNEMEDVSEETIQILDNPAEIEIKVKSAFILVESSPSADIIKDQEGKPIELKEGDCLKAIGESDNYYRVSYNGLEGYVAKDIAEIK